MSKITPNTKIVDLTRFCKSTFTLTFAVEIIGMDVWHDLNEGWLDLGPCQQELKLQYQLYPGQSFEIDILIWPHVAKIWCENQYSYVRAWQFLHRRWLTFSIRHAFPVRVLELINHVATITYTMGPGSLGANAKNDKNFVAFLPVVKFGERRYFAPVLEREETIEQNVRNLLWDLVDDFIPTSYLDGIFNTPYSTTDIRQQDTILFKVQESTLSMRQPIEEEDLPAVPEELVKSRVRRESKIGKEKDKDKKKVVDIQKEKFSIMLSGDAILAGCGRIVAFETTGERPPEQSEVIVLISSNNLPAGDDVPIIFINVETLYDIPIEELRKLRITQIFTRWKIGDEVHESQRQTIKILKSVNFNDHHTVPLQHSKASEITACFLDNRFEIQINGIRQSKSAYYNPSLFGNNKNDRNFGFALPSIHSKYKVTTEEEEILIAVTKIDASSLAKESNGIIRGDFCLYPPKVSIKDTSREVNCTNDIHRLRQPVKPDIIIKPSVILQAQMSLDVCMGLVGCRPRILSNSYLRLYCYTHDLRATNSMLQKIVDINESLLAKKDINDLLTGFALDTVDSFIFYIEGQRVGPILEVWDLTADFSPETKPLFSSSEQHIGRIYAEMLMSATPFCILKMLVPINTLLACPQVYVKPALPLPARSALLKIGRLIASKFKLVPCDSEMPSNEELKSFSLELCVPPRP